MDGFERLAAGRQTVLLLGDGLGDASMADGLGVPHVLKVGGGQVWGEAYPVVGDAGRDIVGGGGLTVAAAGGWLMGGGLSALSRTFGYGIDNVMAFDVVLRH